MRPDEEILQVTRQRVLELYVEAKKSYDIYTSATCINESESRHIDFCRGTMNALKTLFGPKCKPDDPQPKPGYWVPKFGESYWFVSSLFEVVGESNLGCSFDMERIDVGNCFRTEEEARKAAEEVRKCLKAFHERKI